MSSRRPNAFRPAPAYRRRGASSKPTTDQIAKAIGTLSLAGVGSAAGGYAGAQAGKRVGRAFGSRRTGKTVGRTLGKIGGAVAGGMLAGRGDYEIIGNSSNPKIHMDNDGSTIRISRTEYVGDVYSGTGTPSVFDTTVYHMNPGLSVENGGLHQWLPTIARAYEQYRYEQAVIEYRPTSGSSTGSDTSVGEVMMCAQFNNASTDFVNKSQLMNSMFAVSGAPYTKILFPVELAKSSQPMKWLNVRDGDLPDNSDLDLADTCKVTVATQGCPTAGQNLGSLYSHTTIVFQKPTVDSTDSNIEGAVAYITGAADIITEASPFSASTNNVDTISGNTFPLELITSAASTGHIRFPKSFGPAKSIWMVQMAFEGSSAATNNFAMGTHNGFAVHNCVWSANNDEGGAASPTYFVGTGGLTASFYIWTGYFIFNGVTDGSQPYIEINTSSWTGPASMTDLWVAVSRVNSSAFQSF